MSRAEQRRKQREQKKADKQMNAVLRQAGFPEFQLPPAPMRTTNLSDHEVANITGTKIAVLEQWRREHEEFGFAKHKKGAVTMLDKFMEGTRKKYLSIDAAKHGARDTLKMLSEKYEIDVDWSRSMQETIDRFDL